MNDTQALEALNRRFERLQQRVDALEAASSGERYDAIFRSFMALLGKDDKERWLRSSIAAFRGAYNASTSKIARELHVRKARVVVALRELNEMLVIPDEALNDYLRETL